MKVRNRLYLLIISALFLVITLTGCEEILNGSSIISSVSVTSVQYADEENQEFNAYLDDLFVELLLDSALDINFLLRNPETYGLENEGVSVFSYNKSEFDDYMNYIELVISEIEDFNPTSLTRQQALDRLIIIDALSRETYTKNYYYYDKPLGSYLGYQAQLPIVLAEYRFDDIKDIENYFTTIELTQDSFESLVAYENEKVAQGLAMSDVMIDGVIEQCDNFINTSEVNYLITVFNNKVNSLGFLTSVQKTEFKEQNETLIENNFVPAYAYLKDEMLKLKGKGVNNGGLSNFTNGKQYYQQLFSKTLGTDILIDEIDTQIDEEIDSLIDELSSLYFFNNDLYDRLEAYDYSLGMGSDVIVEYLIDHMDQDFPALSLSDVNYQIKTIHESMQENSSPAMYFLSPIDVESTETIYINPLQMGEEADPNYIYQTLAHESLPGHLYQHVYFKNKEHHPVRSLFNYSGYAEGWATYVENYVIKYTSTDTKLNRFKTINELLYAMIMIKTDIGVNYYSWSVNDLKEFLSQYYEIDIEAVTEIYHQMIEVPVNVNEYYYSYFTLLQLKNYMKNQLGSVKYKDMDFHKIILDVGPAPFDIIKDEIDRFIVENK